jgi:hypothetical protein
MNYDFLTKKENSMVAENIYGFRKMNRTNNNKNSKNSEQQSRKKTSKSKNSEQQSRKKNSKGIEVKPSNNVEGQIHENSIQDIPIGYPVDKEKFKDLKKKSKKEDQNMDNEKVSVQEDEN